MLRFPNAVVGVLFLVGCIDASTVSNDDSIDQSEVSSVDQEVASGPDLIESVVGNPPATAVVGGGIAVSDTVKNQGTASAAATFTKYYLSTTTSPQYLLGNRPVGVIAAGGTDAGGTTGTVPQGVPAGSYKIVACADSGSGPGGRVSAVAETDESNNCSASTGSVTVSGPDLTESNVTFSPAGLDPTTGSLTITETVTNAGNASAGASVTRYYLSTDNVHDASDAFIRNCTNGGPTPGRNVAPIGAGSDTGSSTTTPLCVRDTTGLHSPAAGTYYVVACADELNQVPETNETNQCAVSASQLTITKCGDSVIQTGEQCDDGNATSGDGCSSTCQIETKSDLVISAISNPPAGSTVGGSFTLTDTTKNQSTTDGAGASTTTFYLSTDTIRNSNDVALSGNRAVPALNANATSSGTTTVTVMAGTAGGTYFILACADGLAQVSEINENNNCTASTTTVTIGGVDLIVSAISNPPATANVGSSFSINDTTKNQGGSTAASSFTKFYLSTNGSALNYYLATRSVPSLGAGVGNGATTAMTIPAGVANGTYNVVACADAGPGTAGRTSQIPETNEANNCTASTGTVSIGAPDLIITAINNPPATGTAGTTLTFTDTTKNQGSSSAGAFYNKYYLSSNGTTLQWYVGTSSQILSLAAGASVVTTSTGFIRNGVTPGSYFLVSCADSGPGVSGRFSQVAETNENNNCTASAGKITTH